MKKILAALLISLGLVHAADSEFGLGITFDLNNGNNGVGLAIKHDEWKFDFNGGAVAVDYLFIERTLSGNLNWFIGLGGYTDYNFNAIGARLPIGLDYDISDAVDIFIEIIPTVSVSPTLGNFGDGLDGGIRIFF